MSPLQRTAFVSAAFAVTLAACGSAPKEPEPYQSPKTGAVAEELNLQPLPDPVPVPKPRICGLFVVDPAAATFAFDGGDAQGFQLDGIYDDTLATLQPPQNPQVVPLAVAAAWSDSTNAPLARSADPLRDKRGSAYFIDHPQFDFATNGHYWRLGFVSPALGNVWQGKGQYSFDVLDEMSVRNPVLYAQLVLKVRKCDGTTAYYRALDGNKSPVFCTLAQNHAWTHCTATIDLSGVDVVLNAEVRVFVPGGFNYEGAVFLDNLHAQ